MDLLTETSLDRIKDLEEQVEDLHILLDLARADLEDRDLRIKHLIGELSKSRIDPSYEPQISVG